MKINLVLSLVLAMSLIAKAGDAPKPDKIELPARVIPLNDAAAQALVKVELEGTDVDPADCEITFKHALLMNDNCGIVNVYQVVDHKSGSVYKIGVAFHIDRVAKQGV